MNILNILVAGHREARLNLSEEETYKLKARLEMAVTFFQQGTTLRLIVGDADGVDTWTKEIAELNKEIEVILAGQYRHRSYTQNLTMQEFDPAKNLNESIEVRSRGVWLAEQEEDDSGANKEPWISAIDEAKLSYADVMIAVWDGRPPKGNLGGGGTVRLIIEALRRKIPLLWIKTDGEMLWADWTRINTHLFRILDADEGQVSKLHSCFQIITMFKEDNCISCADLATDPQMHLFSKRQDDLCKEWDPKSEKVYRGWVYTRFLTIFGNEKLEGGDVIEAWRGPGTPVRADKPGDALDSLELLWTHFDSLDRAANYAARTHRDQVVLLHLLASLAVFFAVAGSIQLFTFSALWAVLEFFALAVISYVLLKEKPKTTTAHGAWLSLRQSAEAFRVQALLHPFLANLSKLARIQWDAAEKESGLELHNPLIWWVNRKLREYGAPTKKTDASKAYTLKEETDALKSILLETIASQETYHMKTSKRWHRIHERMELAMKLVFFAVIITVCIHLFSLSTHFAEHHGWSWPTALFSVGHWIHAQDWLLLITASGPAFAASIHGIAGKLEIKRIAEKSHHMIANLSELKAAVANLEDPTKNFMALRALAIQTANLIYSEHDAWNKLLNGQNLEAPA